MTGQERARGCLECDAAGCLDVWVAGALSHAQATRLHALGIQSNVVVGDMARNGMRCDVCSACSNKSASASARAHGTHGLVPRVISCFFWCPRLALWDGVAWRGVLCLACGLAVSSGNLWPSKIYLHVFSGEGRQLERQLERQL